MEFSPITEHIYQFETDFNFMGVFPLPVSIWLVHLDGDWILIDGGFPFYRAQMCAAIEKTTAGQGPKILLLTHGHMDHVGCVGAVKAAWKPECICHREEAPFVRGERSYGHLRAKSGPYRYGRWIMRVMKPKNLVTRMVENGQMVGDLQVVHLPGHTPGLIGLLHIKDRALICGDSVMNRRGRLSLPFAFATPDISMARESLMKIISLDFDHLFPSHGSLVFDHAQAELADFVRNPISVKGD